MQLIDDVMYRASMNIEVRMYKDGSYEVLTMSDGDITAQVHVSGTPTSEHDKENDPKRVLVSVRAGLESKEVSTSSEE